MNWADLVAFGVLAEERHFTRAAARLGVSQPALSVRIGRLERVLRARLVDRTSRGAVPTPAGRKLAEWAAATQRGWDEIRLEVADLGAAHDTAGGNPAVGVRGAPTPTVRIAVSRSADPHVVDRLTRDQPGVDWRLRTVVDPATLAERLRLGDVQLGLWWDWPHTPLVDLAGLRALAVRQIPLSVALAATHQLAGVALVDLVDLAGEEWVASADPHLRDALRRVCRQVGGFSPMISHVTDDQAQVAALVAAGRAVTVEAAPAPPAPGVVRRPFRGAPPATVRLAWRPETVSERLVRDVLNILTDAPVNSDAPVRRDGPAEGGDRGATAGPRVAQPAAAERPSAAPIASERRRLARSGEPGGVRPHSRTVPLRSRPTGEPRAAGRGPDAVNLAHPVPGVLTTWPTATTRPVQERPR
ncbi:LysR family transcriptional regulator [Micromonospora sp. NPDC005324]|uniref:LysR family transcriptional regulator n=1 Tax=Micromonospora sp. NPDC005324 TaxID=3157033 RepID=UPI0033B9C845